jgi:hypothetical protein
MGVCAARNGEANDDTGGQAYIFLGVSACSDPDGLYGECPMCRGDRVLWNLSDLRRSFVASREKGRVSGEVAFVRDD